LEALKEEFLQKGHTANSAAHTTLTHTRLGDKNIADSVEALIGAYFTSGGPKCALHFMDAFNLRAPNANGQAIKYGDWKVPIPKREVDWISTHPEYLGRFLPFVDHLEELIGYR